MRLLALLSRCLYDHPASFRGTYCLLYNIESSVFIIRTIYLSELIMFAYYLPLGLASPCFYGLVCAGFLFCSWCLFPFLCTLYLFCFILSCFFFYYVSLFSGRLWAPLPFFLSCCLSLCSMLYILCSFFSCFKCSLPSLYFCLLPLLAPPVYIVLEQTCAFGQEAYGSL